MRFRRDIRDGEAETEDLPGDERAARERVVIITSTIKQPFPRGFIYRFKPAPCKVGQEKSPVNLSGPDSNGPARTEEAPPPRFSRRQVSGHYRRASGFCESRPDGK